MDNEQYINIESGLSEGAMNIENGLSVGAIQIVDKYEIFTEEEIYNINGKVPELDERVGNIEDEIEEINSSLDNIPTKVSQLTNDSGYLTQHQDLSDYAKKSELEVKADKSYVDSAIESVDVSSQLTNYAKKSDLEVKVDKETGKSLISDNEIERLSTLKNYDDTEIKNTLNNKANVSDLHSHSNKTVLDGITSDKVNEWNNKSNFSGNYNDLTNKPTIPTLNGYATEQYVNEELKKIDVTEQLTDYAKKSELHGHSNKSVLDGITSDKVNEWNNKSNFSGNYNDLTNKPTIPTKTSQLTNDIGFITTVPSEYVTDSELNNKGYLTEHQDISHLASKSEVVEYVFPEQFGAKGDGVTDDSAAIQQAIQYAIDNAADTYYHKPIVYMGAKTYKINTGIVLDKRCMQLHCDGKILYDGTDKALSIKHSLMNIYINIIEAPNGTALFLTGDEHQCVTNNIKINRIENSVNGIHLHNFGGSQSMFYNRIDIGSVHSTNICIHIQTDSGYINENYFWLGKLSGADIAIKIVKGGGNRFFKGSFEDLKSNSNSIALWLDNAESNVLRNFRCEENYGKSIIKFVGNNNWNDVWVSHMQLGAIDISELTGGSNNKLRGTIMTGNAGGGGYGAGEVADVSYATGITYNPLCANHWKKLTSTTYTNNVIGIDKTTTSDGTAIATSFDFDSTTNGKTFTLGALYSEYQSIARGIPIVFKFDSGVGRILLKDSRGGTVFDNTNGIYDGHSISVCWNGFDKVSNKNFWSIQILGVENEKTTNKVVAISSASTNEQYPSAKCVYDAISQIDIPEKVFEINNGDFNVIDEPKYQNMLRQAIDTNGNIYNNIGYKSKIRINSSKQEVAYDYSDITGFMDCTGISDKDVIYINGFSFVDEYYNGMVFYDANFNMLQNLRINSNGTVSTTTKVQEIVYIDGGTKATKLAENSYVISFNFNESIYNSYAPKYVRFYGLRNADIKISLNNPIIESESYNAGTVVQTINNKKGHVTLPVLAYGTCSTPAETSEKTVVIDDANWKLEVGNIVGIRHSYTNSASNVTINVNNTGAYPIWYGNSEYTGNSSTYVGYANRTNTYMFTGTHWQWISNGVYPSTATNASLGQGYGTCTTAESTLAKACTISSYSLTVGGIVSIKFTNAVPANSTLNIRTRGAKKIFYRGVAITDGIIKAGDTATFIYDGTQYHLISLDNAVGNIPTKTSQLSNDSGFISSIPSEYITETELNSKGYLTTHQDLSLYAMKSELPTIAQTAGESESLVMSQKAVTDLVNNTLDEREKIEYETVDSVSQMVDTSKQYVLRSTGTIWTYTSKQEFVENNEYNPNTSLLNHRINSGGNVVAFNGALLTDFIEVEYINPYNITIDGIQQLNVNYSSLFAIDYYDSSKTKISQLVNGNLSAPNANNTCPLTFNLFSGQGGTISNTKYIRIKLGIKTDNNAITSSDVENLVINIEAKNSYQEISTWVDTEMRPESATTNYVDLLVKINKNVTDISEVDRRVTELESGSGSIVIPSFWENAVNECIAKIKSLQQGRHCITFPFFSDNHQNINYSGVLIAKVMKECNIPYCFYGGDSISSGYIASEQEMINQDRAFDSMMSYIPNGRFCRTVGNHDGYWAVSSNENYSYTREQVYELFLREESIAQNKIYGEDGTYYYVDDLSSKTRWILLNPNGGLDSIQLSWLQNVAINFDQPGWGIVFISHQPISNHYHALISNATEVHTIINNYINGSDTNKADVIGWFSGHIHRDRIYTGVATNTSDDSVGTALPFKQVTITSDNTAISYDDATTHPIAADDESHAIDFVTINRKTRTVKITRLGIGEDREFTF